MSEREVQPPRRTTLIRLVHALLAVLLSGGAPAVAHEVPGEMVVESYVKPEGGTLHVVTRLPLVLLQGFGFPTREPGHLDLAGIDQQLEQAGRAVAREIVLLEGGRRLVPEGVRPRISQPSEGGAFASFETALAHVTGPPLPENAEVFWDQGYFDVHLRYPGLADPTRLAVEARLAAGLGERLKLLLTYLPPDGAARSFEVHGGGRIELDPGRIGVARTFVGLGFARMAASLDAMLVVVGLALPFGRDLRRLGPILATFLVLQAAALAATGASGAVGAGWSRPLAEALLALVIVCLGLANIVAAWLYRDPARAASWRWPATGFAGAALGLAFALDAGDDLQLAGAHRAIATAAFGVGTEIGQLVIAALVAALFVIVFVGLRTRRVVVVLASALIAHMGWHRLLQRVNELRYVDWPAF